MILVVAFLRNEHGFVAAPAFYQHLALVADEQDAILAVE